MFLNKFPVLQGGHPSHLVHRDHHGVHHAGRSYVPQLGGLGSHLLRLLLLHHPHHGQHLVKDENSDLCHQIGFGDLVPTRSFFGYEEAGLGGKLQMLAAVGYCVLGIAIIAMCISFIQVRKQYRAILPSLPFIAPIDLNAAFSAIATIAIIAMRIFFIQMSAAFSLITIIATIATITNRRELPRKCKIKGTRRKS